MALPGRVYTGAALADRPELWPSAEIFRTRGHITDYVGEAVTAPSGDTLKRDWLRHPGAVGVLAIDDDERLAVVVQYRHPAAFTLIEPPAGLLDVGGEAAVSGARRELAEEAQLQAEDWRTLVDVFTSPGSSQESIRIFLARGLRPAPRPEGFVLEGEEAEMGVGWAAVDEAVAAILAGRLQCPTLVMGVLAYWTARAQGRLDALRPADAPWPARAAKLARDQA
jgi:ADP-ribose pyrophosphatase